MFLPGFMCDWRLFSQQIESQSEQGHECSTADLSSDGSIVELAQRALRNRADQIVPVGLSMGGIVALEMYRQAPDRIVGLALLGTTYHSDKATQQRIQQLQRVRAGELNLVLRDELKPNYMHPSNRTPARLELLAEMARDMGDTVFERQTRSLMERRSYADLLPKISCPTLVLVGENDTVCPPSIHEVMAQSIPNARLAILPECGHLSAMERPDLVSDAILKLVGTIRSGSADKREQNAI